MYVPNLILASESPRRRELLGYLDIEFVTMASEAEESSDSHLTAEELAMLNAWRKARAVAADHPDRLTLGADTVVCLEETVFGKPRDLREAHRMLESLQGTTHRVVTGLALLQPDRRFERVISETTWVTFRELSASRIDRYLEVIQPLDKAGGYAIQDHGEMIVESVHGSLTNVIGLPLGRLAKELARWDESSSR